MATKNTHTWDEKSLTKQAKVKNKKKKKRQKDSDSKIKTEDDLNLQDILELGGDESDVALLEDMRDEEEAMDNVNEDLDAEPIKRDEIRDFIKTLGFRKYRLADTEDSSKNEKKKKKDKTIKLASMPVPEEEQVSETPFTHPSRKERKNKFKIQHGEISSSTDRDEPDLNITSHLKNYKPRKQSLLKSEGKWFEEETEVVESVSAGELSDNLLREMVQFASKLLQDEVNLYKSQRERMKKSEMTWISTVLSSGTLGDKMAALTLLVQDSPVHNLASLDTLISMAKKKGKRECMMAVDTLKELFMSDLLPDKRKLRQFEHHSPKRLFEVISGNKDVTDRRLLLWYYEGQLKERYSSFIKAIETMSFDTIAATKQSALGAIFKLLAGKPEQEKTLLTILVNKVGDPDHKVASKASHLLSKLVDHHPNMKLVVVKEVEQLLYRPNVSQRAQYYSVCFLNQLVLSQHEKDLSNRLIAVYFTFFKAFVKKGKVDSKMMSALLTGVNRAYPYAKVDYLSVSAQMNTLYQIVHVVNFSTSLQALMLLYQVMDSSQSVSDRYYMALYKKMLDPALKTTSKQAIFLNLLFKSMRKDLSEKRIKAFIKRLLQTCSYQSPKFICATLILLSEVLKTKAGILNVNHSSGKWELDDDDEEEHFVDLPDPEDEGTSAKVQPTIEESQVTSIGQTNPSADSGPAKLAEDKSTKSSSWIHRSNLGEKSVSGHYDPYHRNPLYCCVDLECVWELEKLASHYHPSVSLFAQTVLKNQPISYSGDPLHDFALIRFLDRFVYKNPKKQHTAQAQQTTIRPHKKEVRVKGIKKIPVNSELYLEKGEDAIPVEEKFFYRYFRQRADRQEQSRADKEEDSDVESVSDEEFDAFMDDYEKHVDSGDVADMDFDFAGEFGKRKGQKRKRGKKDEEAEESDDDSDKLDDLSDEEVNFSDDEDFKSAFDRGHQGSDDDNDDMGGMHFDEEDVAFSDENDDLAKFELTPTPTKGKKRTVVKGKDVVSRKKSRKEVGSGSSSLFAAAEEFSHLMDENAGSKFDQGTVHALANKDNADVKQLNWEVARDQWVRGTDWRSKRKGKWSGKAKFKTKGKPSNARRKR